MLTYTRRIRAMLILLCYAVLAPAATAQNPGMKAPEGGLRIYTCGNSYTNSTLNTGLRQMLESGGHEIEEKRTAGVAGASLHVVLHADRADLEEHLAQKSWDILTLQTYYGSIEKESAAAIEIVGMARKNNPDVRVIMFGIWPPYSVYKRPPEERTEAWTEAVREKIKEAYPDQVVQVAPVSLIYRELYPMIETAAIPNIPSADLLFRDGGHPGKFGAYPINCAFASMIYREEPFDYGNVSVEDQTIPQETADVMQRVVWDVLQTYPGALMNDEPTIATRRLETAVAGLEFSKQLDAINVSGNQTWTLAGGKLPQGLELAADGALAGTPSEMGEFTVKVRLEDAGKTSEREYILKVDPDAPPVIVTEQVPDIPCAQYFEFAFQSRDGVGMHTWAVTAGELPPGTQLLPYGSILGTPGKAGEYPVTVTVTDSHPEQKQKATRSFTLVVTDPPEDTLFVTKYDEFAGVCVDGRFDEPYWNFDHTIEKTVAGEPTARVDWSTFWTHDALYIGCKVHVGEMGLTPEDAIEVFIDGNNNDEVIYNYDDAHWRFKRDPQSAGERIIAGYMRFFNSSFASVETDYGYDIEIELDNNALGGRGIITAWPDYAVYGFDIGVRQGRGEDIHSKVWKGNEKNPEDTSPFGTIIFRGEASEPNAVRRLVNGDFADDFYHAAGVMNTRKMPKHIWVSSRNNGVFTAWTLEPGKGIFQRHSRGRHEGVKGSGLMQIIDRPAPGDYVLSFEYQAPRHGFRIGAWGATPPERSTFNAGQITPPDGGGWTETMQYFGPTQVEVTGDEDWHSMDIPFSIGGEATDLFLCIVGDETGDTGVALRNFEIKQAE